MIFGKKNIFLNSGISWTYISIFCKRSYIFSEPTHDRSVNLPTKDRIKELDYGMEVKKNDPVPELTKKEPVHIYERFTKADDKENKKEEVNSIFFFFFKFAT